MATKKATPVPPQPTTDSKAPKKQPVVAKLPATKTATAASTAPAAPATTVTPVSLTPAKTEDSVVPGDASGAEVAPVKDNAVSVIIEKVNNLFASFKEVQNLLKVLSKDYEKQQKIIEKAQKRQNAKNSPSGFAKPNKISDELCDFIGVPHGTEKSRTDITRFINSYVKEHNLNKPENKRFILPDDKLKKILNVGDKEDINYFILQKLISHHFPPSASKLAASV
jgi:hypothetical protein